MMQTLSIETRKTTEALFRRLFSSHGVSDMKVNCLLDSVMYDEAVFVVVGLLWFWQSMSLMNITVHTCQSNKLMISL